MKLGKRQWPVWLWIVHSGILINFLLQMGYAAAMVFLVIAPETAGPLWENAHTFPFEKMVTRRLYAIEFWIARWALPCTWDSQKCSRALWMQTEGAGRNDESRSNSISRMGPLSVRWVQ